MVNLNKWEKIEKSEIKEGDILKVVANGTAEEYTSRSVAKSKVGVTSAYGGSWLAGDLELVIGDLASNFTEDVYRRKVKESEVVFEFPDNLGAVIEGTKKTYGTKKRFVKTGIGWNYDGLNYRLDQLQAVYKNFVVLSDGVA